MPSLLLNVMRSNFCNSYGKDDAMKHARGEVVKCSRLSNQIQSSEESVIQGDDRSGRERLRLSARSKK